MLEETAHALAKSGKFITPSFAATLEDLCRRTEQHWQDELNPALCRSQMETAYARYSRARVWVRGIEYRFAVPRLVEVPGFGPAHGEKFRLMDFIPGEVFIKAARDHRQPPDELAAYATALAALELSAKVAGLECDLDCHGGNVKLIGPEGAYRWLGRYDFGGFTKRPAHAAELHALGRVIRRALDASAGLKDIGGFTGAYYQAVSDLTRNGDSRLSILTDTQKQLVSLCDFLKLIQPDNLDQVLGAALAHAHPAFLSGLGAGRLQLLGLKLKNNAVRVAL